MIFFKVDFLFSWKSFEHCSNEVVTLADMYLSQGVNSVEDEVKSQTGFLV